jgi:4-amino-4-deoxy-L-arabinose transferase-like glycosyltransferase
VTPRLASWALLVLAAAAALRLPHLGARPMHADEAIQADKFGGLLERGEWPYDPRDYHGPLLAWLTLGPARLSGRTTYAALDETVLRLAPALCGIALALSPLLFASVLGETAAVAAALFVAVSPSMVYYSRFYIAETLLALLTVLLLVAMIRAANQPGWIAWAAGGVPAGLAVAAKETAVLAIAAAAVAAAVAFRPRPRLRQWLAFPAACLLTAAVFIPPHTWPEIARTYLERGFSAGWHSQPWWHYFRLLLGVDSSFTEAFPLILACGAALLPAPGSGVRFLRWYALLVAILYSAIPYKTPWCVLSAGFAIALLAGESASSLARLRRLGPAVMAAGLMHLGWQSYLAAGLLAISPRNPWVYAQTGPDALAIREAVARCVPPGGPAPDIAVYSAENLWPLPWYFRDSRVRWFRATPTAGRAGDIVLVTPEAEAGLLRLLYDVPPPGERPLYLPLSPRPYQLRPGVEVRGYIAASLAERCVPPL